MAIPARPARSRKTIKRGPGKRIVEDKSFRLADEVRYIQRRAADYDSRIVRLPKPLPSCTVPVLASVPPIVRLPPPSPELTSRLSAPLLVKAPVIVSAVVPSTATVPLFVKALLSVSGVASNNLNRPALLVNPLPPL